MSLGENSLVAAYQGRGQLKSRPSGTRVVTLIMSEIPAAVFLFPPCSAPIHLFFFSVYDTRNTNLRHFLLNALIFVSSCFLRVQLSHPYVATGHTIRLLIILLF